MKGIKKFFKLLGPGFITGASDDDPAGVATYSLTGSIFGLTQLWLAPFCLPLMIAVQDVCGRIGLVTGKGLAGVIRRHYSKQLLYAVVVLLLIANTINIGANLGAMAESAQLLLPPVPFVALLILMTAVSLFMQVFIPYTRYVKYLKWLAFTLLAYILASLLVQPDWREVLYYTFIPHFTNNREYVLNVVAFLGTSISPYLFFWQASEEVEEELEAHKLRRMGVGEPRVTKRDLTNLNRDTMIGMFFSQLVAWFIVIATGSTLYTAGIHEITSATEAAKALQPVAGSYAFVLFALGIISTGLLAVPVLAGSGAYAVSETFRWNEGLSQKVQRAKGFYGVIALSMLAGFIMNFVGINAFQALYYSAVVNGIIAAPLLIAILFISNNRDIMGQRVNSLLLNIMCIITIFVMTAASILLLADLFL
jgi:NRAMP (natural resistance-associated macrophage protein)-like metal ion transporter